MNPLLHALRHYFRRFRIEILLFWIVSVALSVSIWKGADIEVTIRLSWAEALLMLWLIVRVVGAESILKTTSGWHLRPISAKQLFGAGVWLLVLAILPAFVFRGWIWQCIAGPSFGNWADVLWNDVMPLVAFAIAAAWAAMAFRLLKEREVSGLWVFVATPLALWAGFLWFSKFGNEGTRSWETFGIERLPSRDHLLGNSSEIRGWESELAGKMPLGPATLELPRTLELDKRLRIVVEDARLSGDTVKVRYALRCVGGLPRRDQFAFMIRYPDGSYAATANFKGHSSWNKHLLFQVSELRGEATFLSPLSLPWTGLKRDAVMDGAELWVFRMYGERLFPKLEKLSPEKLEMGVASLELAHTNFGDSKWWYELRETSRARADQLLKWPTWSDRSWVNLVEPVLKEKRLDIAMNASLRRRVRTDVRLVPMMALWPDAVEPVLSQRLEDGRPFDAANLSLLLGSGDFKWNSDVEKALLRVRSWEGDLTGELTGKWHQPFEEFLKVQWMADGGSGNAPATHELAKFAAARGDLSALRFLARANDENRLRTLVAAPLADPIGWLAENSQKLVYDPELRRFTAP